VAGSRNSLAKTSQAQEKEQGLPAQEADSGKRWRESLAKYDRDTSSWKTHQCSLLEGLESFSETFPNWGMMLDGELFPLPMSEHLTCANESGSLPTPDANMGKRGTQENWTPKRKSGHSAQYSLNQAVRDMERFPTPTCSDTRTGSMKSTQQKEGSMHSVTLPQYVKRWGTPKCSDSRHAMTDRGKGNPGEQVAGLHGGKLNPDWVEWLMGVPIGWSALQPLETHKFLLWRQQHGES
jgi:hypothetical protein